MWEILIANDPDDDFNLTVELWCNDKHYGTVKWNHSTEQYDLTIYQNNNDIIIPCKILKKMLDAAETLQSTREI